MTWLAPFIVLSLVVVAHEAGHFLAARWCGVRVLTFSLGFGPTLLARRWRGTEFAIRLLPLGGYVKPAGSLWSDESAAPPAPDELPAKSRLSRAIVYAAGPLASMLLGIVLMSVVSIAGAPLDDDPGSRFIDGVVPKSAAAAAGFRAGDVLDAAAGASYAEWPDLRDALLDTAGERTSAWVLRDRVPVEVAFVLPRGDDLASFGLILRPAWIVLKAGGQPSSPAPRAASVTATDAVRQSVRLTGAIAADTSRLVADTARGHPPSLETLGGPVAMGQVSVEAAARFGWLGLLQVAGMASLSLAFFNLIPVPPLDGGHLMILAIEGTRRRQLGRATKLAVFLVGIALVLALVAALTYADIRRLVG